MTSSSSISLIFLTLNSLQVVLLKANSHFESSLLFIEFAAVPYVNIGAQILSIRLIAKSTGVLVPKPCKIALALL